MTRIALLALLMIGQAAQTPSVPVHAPEPSPNGLLKCVQDTCFIPVQDPKINPSAVTFECSKERCLISDSIPILKVEEPEATFDGPTIAKNGRKEYSISMKPEWFCAVSSNEDYHPTLIQLTCVKADGGKK